MERVNHFIYFLQEIHIYKLGTSLVFDHDELRVKHPWAIPLSTQHYPLPYIIFEYFDKIWLDKLKYLYIFECNSMHELKLNSVWGIRKHVCFVVCRFTIRYNIFKASSNQRHINTLISCLLQRCDLKSSWLNIVPVW